MNAGSAVNKAFAVLFAFIGVFLTYFGGAFLVSWPQNQTEWIICLGFLSSGLLLLYSAWSTWKKGADQEKAERAERIRLHKHVQKVNDKGVPSDISEQTVTEVPNAETGAPDILATWFYPKNEWNPILNLLAAKTRKEELYTAIWFPIIFGLVFFAMWWVGVLIGIGFGLFYVWFRADYVKKNFKIPAGKSNAEVIITDAYLNVNGHFVHYGDGRYFLKELRKAQDATIGNHLHFVIGWFTSKGLPAQLDLYLPIPTGKEQEAEDIIHTYQRIIK